jgi:3-oxoacyl-[acyl-carrier protein] reductase
MTEKPLSGRTAIITGANQGLGKELAKAFLEAGSNIALCARDENLLAATCDQLARTATSQQKVIAFKADVSKEEDVAKFVDFAMEAFGKLDVLLNNAGIYGPKGCLDEIEWNEWKQTIEIDLYGPALMCRKILPHFKQQNYGKIINLSGGGATAPLPRLSAYAVAKAGLVRLTETLAHELVGFNIDVNAIAPGALNTRLLDEVLEAGPEKVGKEFYTRSLKQKDEGGAPMNKAAALSVFLASRESDGISGRLLSALWDPWHALPQFAERLKSSEIYTLRRIVPADRGENWEEGQS